MPSLTIKQLLDKANEGYGEGQLSEYYDESGTFHENATGGDALARFIVIELTETFDGKAKRKDQVDEACRVMLNARDDIWDVATAIGEL